jgi:hypothetical protein
MSSDMPKPRILQGRKEGRKEGEEREREEPGEWVKSSKYKDNLTHTPFYAFLHLQLMSFAALVDINPPFPAAPLPAARPTKVPGAIKYS